ncbi:MAG: winged helix-turn-helix domain-containing protein, partial [Leptolyngbyaceae cyanobacterium]
MKRSASSVPTFDTMLLPTIQALQMLGGSGTTEEIYDKVVQILNLPDKVLEIPHGNTSQSEVEYRLAWSRTYLKKYGLLQNSSRGIWSLASTSIDLDSLDAKEIVKTVRDSEKNKVLSSTEFTQLFQEFHDTFVQSPDGQNHITFYGRHRQTGQQNFAEMQSLFTAQDITTSEQVRPELAF